jgi:DNA-binding HxlR family transcriptional regulator
MAAKRTYADSCGVARALDLVGERWALLVVRELLLGPKRFTDLRAGLPGVSADVLAQRLRGLEDAGVVMRRALPRPAASQVYELTERGHDLEPVVLALGRWGSSAPIRAASQGLSIDAFVIALKTLFDAGAARGLDAGYELRLGDQRFRVRVADRRLEIDRGMVTPADLVIESDAATLTAVLWHGQNLEETIAAGAIELTGPRRLLTRFLQLFPLPVPAAP